RRAIADRPHPRHLLKRLQPAQQHLLLALARTQRAGILVQVPVVAYLVPRRDDRPQRLRIGLSRVPGDEKGRPDLPLRQEPEDPLDPDRPELPPRDHARRGRPERPDPDRDRVEIEGETDGCALLSHGVLPRRESPVRKRDSITRRALALPTRDRGCPRV